MTDKPPFPRKGSGLYPLVYGGSDQINRTLKWFQRINRYLVIPLYRIRLLPLFGVGRVILLLMTRGRRTRKERWTPLEYRRRGDEIFIFSGRGINADWYKNMKEDMDSVRVLLGFHEFKPKIRIVNEKEEKIDIFKFYVQTYPWAAKTILGWNSELDDPETANFESLSELIEVIKLRFDRTNR